MSDQSLLDSMLGTTLCFNCYFNGRQNYAVIIFKGDGYCEACIDNRIEQFKLERGICD